MFSHVIRTGSALTVVFGVVEDGLSPVLLLASHSSTGVSDETSTGRQLPQSHDRIFAARQHILTDNHKTPRHK